MYPSRAYSRFLVTHFVQEIAIFLVKRSADSLSEQILSLSYKEKVFTDTILQQSATEKQQSLHSMCLMTSSGDTYILKVLKRSFLHSRGRETGSCPCREPTQNGTSTTWRIRNISIFTTRPFQQISIIIWPRFRYDSRQKIDKSQVAVLK